MAVAQVVGGAGEEQRVVGDRLDQPFGRGDDFDDSGVVLGGEPVAAVQMIAAFEEDARFGPRGERHLEPAAFAFVIGEGRPSRSPDGRCVG